eukprot:scaffold17368_cov136-Isochrysis_galbana.AAC.3
MSERETCECNVNACRQPPTHYSSTQHTWPAWRCAVTTGRTPHARTRAQTHKLARASRSVPHGNTPHVVTFFFADCSVHGRALLLPLASQPIAAATGQYAYVRCTLCRQTCRHARNRTCVELSSSPTTRARLAPMSKVGSVSVGFRLGTSAAGRHHRDPPPPRARAEFCYIEIEEALTADLRVAEGVAHRSARRCQLSAYL